MDSNQPSTVSAVNKSSPVSVNKHYSVLSPTGVADADHEAYDQLRPNDLFTLLEDLQWKKAEFTLKQSPTDAKQWTTKTEKNRSTWRRLPIHQACILQPTPAIISALLDCCPASAKEKDNYQRTPLHCAIIHNADIDVIFLILDAYYDAKHEKDFFGKTPRDYLSGNSEGNDAPALTRKTSMSQLARVIFGKTPRNDIVRNNEEIGAALTQSEAYISQFAYKVRAKLEASASHIAAIKNCNNEFRTPSRMYRAQAMESLLEEELDQARVEAVAAYCERDVAMANNDVLRLHVKDLEEQLRQKQEVIDKVGDMAERNRNLAKLLVFFEKKNQTLTDDISEREGQIQDSKEKMKQAKEARKDEFKALSRKSQLVVEKLKATVGVLTAKLAEVTEKDEAMTILGIGMTSTADSESELQSIEPCKAFTEEKIGSLEEMVKAYMLESNDLQLQCNSLEEQLKKDGSNRRFSRSSSCSRIDMDNAELKICMLEAKLEASERVKECLEKEIVLLTSSNAISRERAEELKGKVTTYQIKVRNLEEGYYTMTSQLIVRTRLLHDAIDKSGGVHGEKKGADCDTIDEHGDVHEEEKGVDCDTVDEGGDVHEEKKGVDYDTIDASGGVHGEKKGADCDIIDESGDVHEEEKGVDCDIVDESRDVNEEEKGVDCDIIDESGDVHEEEKCADCDTIDENGEANEEEKVVYYDTINESGDLHGEVEVAVS